ncbi:hypothetical protein EMIT053CA3_230034 [Pseudomonas donghuensis]
MATSFSFPSLFNEVFDEYEFLEVRACPYPVRRLFVLRPELHGLVPARPAGGADRR